MDRDRIFAATAAERSRLADLIDELDDARLATPSLCPGWDVTTVAAPLVSRLTDGLPSALRRAVRCGGSTARAIAELPRLQAERPAPEIAADLRRLADNRCSLPPHGPRDPLADVLVHGGDIRWLL